MYVQEGWTARDGLKFAHRIIRHPDPGFSPTLFVSGAFQTMDSWARFAAPFARETTVLLVDPPGMGASDLLPAEVGVDFLAACLQQVLDEHGIEGANVIAASYGTPSALRLAQTRPHRVNRIVLAGTMRELPPALHARIAAAAELARGLHRVALADVCVEGMLCRDHERPVERRGLAARVLRAGILRMSDPDLLKFAANTERLLRHAPIDISQPIAGPEALVFTGEHDCFTLPAACREVAAAFERVWFTTIRRADHLFHLERPDTVLDIFLRFMRRTLTLTPTAGWSELEPLDDGVATRAARVQAGLRCAATP